MKRLAALLALVLAGCGTTQIELEYAATGGDSVNGIVQFAARLGERATVVRQRWLGPELIGCDAVVHVRPEVGLPEAESWTWVQRWLEEHDDDLRLASATAADAWRRGEDPHEDEPRTFVLILRDGTLGPFLLRRWAETVLPGWSATAAAERRDRLLAQAQASAERPWPASEQWGPVVATAVPLRSPTRLHGPGLPATPPAFAQRSVRVQIELADEPVGWIDADGPSPWMLVERFGRHRLIIVASAQPLLDAGLVDPSARRMAQALLDLVVPVTGDGRRQRVAILRTLEPPPARPERHQDTQSHPIALLLTRDPFRWIAWHALALLLIAGAAGVWVGRRRVASVRHGRRFGDHIAALGRQLRRDHAAAWCRAQLRRLRPAAPPSPPEPPP